MDWNDQFLTLYQDCLNLYRSNTQNLAEYYTGSDLEFLSSIGYKPREFFDFVEDFVNVGAPSPSTALMVASVRRDYFLTVQKGIADDSSPLLASMDLPTFGDELDGIVYLPRIIMKARAKLKGLLDPDLMFCCGGDRRFLQDHGNMHPADFLRHVWAAKDDDMAIARFVREWVDAHEE